ncbi:ABC transporter permease [Desulfothermus naphthae]
MLNGFIAVYLREILILKRKIKRQILSMSISPLLYLIAFGYAMGDKIVVHGHSYIEFLIPGLVAMSTMTYSFGISSEINIARFYWQIFDEFQASPISDFEYVLGEVAAAITRALLGVVIILVLGYLFGVYLNYFNIYFIGGIILNSFVFASIAVALAMLVKSHADQAFLSSFVITPMAFLGGTFFPVDRLPSWAQIIIKLLPITHAAKVIRKSAFGDIPNINSYLILFILGIIFFAFAIKTVAMARD